MFLAAAGKRSIGINVWILVLIEILNDTFGTMILIIDRVITNGFRQVLLLAV